MSGVAVQVRKLSFWLGAFFLLGTVLQFLNLTRDFLDGGSPWKQGDWLINIENVFVRRGTLGSLLIRIADIFQTSPLSVTIVLQAILLIATVLMTWLALRRSDVTAKLFLVACSAGFFLSQWNADWNGTFRKEIIVFLSLAVLAEGASRGPLTNLKLIGSALCFIAAVTVHEGLIFFLPLYLVALHFAGGNLLSPSRRAFTVIFLLAVAGVFALNLLHARLPTVDPVCQPLLERGFAPEFCDGAIESLTHDLRTEIAMAADIHGRAELLNVAYAYALCSLPFLLYFYDGRNTGWKAMGLLFAVGLPFVPLYVVAMDWGRWVAFHMNGAIYLLLIMRCRGMVAESRRTWPLPLLAGIWLLPYLATFGHWEPKPIVGAAIAVPRYVLEFF